MVTEVALELSGDRRDREGGERAAGFWTVAADRHEQGHPGDLDQVVPVRAAIGVPVGEGVGEGEVQLDQFGGDGLAPGFRSGFGQCGEERISALFAGGDVGDGE